MPVYYEFIQEPIDLSTIKNKIEVGIIVYIKNQKFRTI